VLALAVRSLAVPVPDDALRALAPPGLDPELFSLLDEEIWGGDAYTAAHVGGNMAVLLTQGTARSRLALFRNRLFPTRAEIVTTYGVAASNAGRIYVCYARRLVRLVGRYLGAIFSGQLRGPRALAEIALAGKRHRVRSIVGALIHDDRS
jgi:hypothetical protein